MVIFGVNHRDHQAFEKRMLKIKAPDSIQRRVDVRPADTRSALYSARPSEVAAFGPGQGAVAKSPQGKISFLMVSASAKITCRPNQRCPVLMVGTAPAGEKPLCPRLPVEHTDKQGPAMLTAPVY
jgi:hypothetical protein